MHAMHIGRPQPSKQELWHSGRGVVAYLTNMTFESNCHQPDCAEGISPLQSMQSGIFSLTLSLSLSFYLLACCRP